MNDKERLTKLWRNKRKALSVIENRLIKEPFRKSELADDLAKANGILTGVQLAIDAIAIGDQTDLEDFLEAAVK